MKILIIKLGAIGDVVHSTVIAQAIKEKYPDYEIHFLTMDFIAPLISNNRFLSKVFSYDSDANWYKILKLGLSLHKEKYDIIFNLTNSLKQIVLAVMASGKIYKRSKKRIHAVDSFYNTALTAFPELKKPAALDLGVNKNIKERLMKNFAAENHPIIIFSPGGDSDNSRQGRTWSDEYWIELGNMFVQEYNAKIIIIGSKNEQTTHQKFSVIKNSSVLSGRLSLEETAALLSYADLIISGDSGPLHIADAVGAKTVAIMGSTSPSASCPYSVNGCYIEPQISCKYCGLKKCNIQQGENAKPCMLSIKPDMVMNFVKSKNYFSTLA